MGETPSTPADAEGAKPPELSQQERAQRTIEAIFSGGDLAAETLRLSNEFTDRQESRLRAWLGRRGRSDG